MPKTFRCHTSRNVKLPSFRHFQDQFLTKSREKWGKYGLLVSQGLWFLGRTIAKHTRVERRFFSALFCPKQRKRSRKWPEMAPFFFYAKASSHETLVIFPSEFLAFHGCWHRTIRICVRIAAEAHDTMPLSCRSRGPLNDHRLRTELALHLKSLLGIIFKGVMLSRRSLINVFSLIFLSLLFGEELQNHPKKQGFFSCRTPKIPGQEGQNAQKSKEIPCNEKSTEIKKSKEDQG